MWQLMFLNGKGRSLDERTFAEDAMSKWVFCAVIATILVAGCKKAAVRDASVYKAELDFIDAAAEEQVERGKALIASSCKCVEIEGVKAFGTRACSELAETILVIEARMGYHTDMMRFLGGLTDKRPPEESPEIPEPETLCPYTPPPAPVREPVPEEEVVPPEDGGIVDA